VESNAEQIEYWNGAAGAHWVDREAEFDAQLAPFVEPILDAAAVGPGDRVLDVGCGNGALSRAAATRAERVTGVDISAPMLDRARAHASELGLENVTFVEADAQTHGFAPEFDVVVSRFGVMFFADAVSAFRNLRRVLRPGGRCVFVCWQDLFANEWVAVPGAAMVPIVGPPPPMPPNGPGPFALADPERLLSILTDAGFSSVDADDVRIPILVGGGLGLHAAVEFFMAGGMAQRFLEGADDVTTARAVAAAREALVPFQTPEGVRMGSAAWLVRAAR
jgi:SAM-dependent methyltransferase